MKFKSDILHSPYSLSSVFREISTLKMPVSLVFSGLYLKTGGWQGARLLDKFREWWYSACATDLQICIGGWKQPSRKFRKPGREKLWK